MRSMATSGIVLSLLAALSLGSAAHGAAPSKEELSKQQIEYAKQLYAEGLAAMEAQDYGTALTKFDEAYRYAPDKHLFNFNIGMAALLGGDCNRAKGAFQYFLAHVPKHPERKTAEAKLQEIEASGCAKALDPEDEAAEGTLEEAPGGTLKDREKQREQQQRESLLLAALAEVREAKSLYTSAAKQQKRPFAGVARQKKRAEKKLLKLLATYEIHAPAPAVVGSSLPGGAKKACEQAVAREKAAAKHYAKVLDTFEEVDVYRVFNRLQKTASKRFVKVFEDCAYGKK